MSKEEKLIENLLLLDGERFLINETLGLWVKFDVKRVSVTSERPSGIKYSLTLHDRKNKRILGFDNAHSLTSNEIYDHWHRDEKDNGRPYHYQDAGKLLEDFWKQVDRVLRQMEEDLK